MVGAVWYRDHERGTLRASCILGAYGTDPIAGVGRTDRSRSKNQRAPAPVPFSSLQYQTTSMRSYSHPVLRRQALAKAVETVRELDNNAPARRPVSGCSLASSRDSGFCMPPLPRTTVMLGNALLGAGDPSPAKRSTEFSRFLDRQVRGAHLLPRDGLNWAP